MFKKLFKKDDEKENDNSALEDFISKAGLTELRSLLLGNIERFVVDEILVVEVLRKITHEDETSHKRYLETDDNDMKLKKGFELVIAASNSKHLSVEAVELIEKFITMYKDIIDAYDTRNKQIYMHKLKKAAELSISKVEQISGFINKMAVIDRA